MLVFCKLTLALLHVLFVPMMILYLTYVGSKWIRGGPMPFKTSWISEHEDALSIFVSSLKLCIVLTILEFIMLSL